MKTLVTDEEMTRGNGKATLTDAIATGEALLLMEGTLAQKYDGPRELVTIHGDVAGPDKHPTSWCHTIAIHKKVIHDSFDTYRKDAGLPASCMHIDGAKKKLGYMYRISNVWELTVTPKRKAGAVRFSAGSLTAPRLACRPSSRSGSTFCGLSDTRLFLVTVLWPRPIAAVKEFSGSMAAIFCVLGVQWNRASVRRQPCVDVHRVVAVLLGLRPEQPHSRSTLRRRR